MAGRFTLPPFWIDLSNRWIDEDRFVDVNADRFKGNYALDFNAVDQEILIPNAKVITRIDLSKQFDIYIFFTPDQIDPSLSGNNPILWSFLNASHGLEIGLTNLEARVTLLENDVTLLQEQVTNLTIAVNIR